MSVGNLRLVDLDKDGDVIGRGARTLSDFGLAERDGHVVKITGQGPKETQQLVANFLTRRILTGTARFLHGPGGPVHLVDVVHPTEGPFSVEILGSVYNAQNFEDSSHGKLVVVSTGNFQTYLAYKIEQNGIQSDDPSADRVYLVGAYDDKNGKLVPNDAVEFPKLREECWYHRHTFAASGNPDVFHRVAALQDDDSIRTLLVWGLGTPLKGALGWAYPHLDATADSGVGKNTLSDALRERFGWLSMAGPPEFGTDYRSKKAVANSIMPIQIQEVGRLRLAATDRLTQALNLSYNAEPTSHGHADKHFVLCAPALLWGQDLPIDDVALLAKMVRVHPTAEKKNPEALRKLRRSSDVWPAREWVEFLCKWANERDVKLLAAEKADWLREQLVDSELFETSNTDRAIWNYAVLLVVAEALNAFGVSVDIEASVVALAGRHLGEYSKDRASVARRVLDDLLLEIQRPAGQSAFVHDLRPEGLYFKPKNVLHVLRGRGYRYDIRSPRKLTEMLKREKLGKAGVQHRIARIQSRFFFVPTATLAEFDVEFDGGGSR